MTTDSQFKTYPFCGEEILSAAIKCKHCKETVADKTCSFCGETIKASAIKCPHCKSELFNNSYQAQVTQSSNGGMIGFAITSLTLGILGMLGSIEAGSRISDDEAAGLLLFLIINLTFGIIALVQKRDGKGMAIAGITLGVLSII